MKLWLTALAVAVASPAMYAAANFVPQGQGSTTTEVTTASYELVVYGSASAEADSASLGASYGRIEEVGSLAGGSWLLDPALLGAFPLLNLSPNAGFESTEVLVPLPAEFSNNNTVVRFDGVLAATVANTVADTAKVVAPTHLPGPVDVTVENAGKSVTYESGFAYIPALTAPAQASIGQHLQLRLSGNPGTQFWVFYSESLGAPLSLTGFTGTFDLDLNTALTLGETSIPVTLAGGATTHEGYLELDMPKDPSLVGKTFFVQSASADPNSATGTYNFTNHTTVTVKN